MMKFLKKLLSQSCLQPYSAYDPERRGSVQILEFPTSNGGAPQDTSLDTRSGGVPQGNSQGGV